MTINWPHSYVVKYIPKYGCVTAMCKREDDQTLVEPDFVAELGANCRHFNTYAWFCDHGNAFYPAFSNDGNGGAYIVRKRPRTQDDFFRMAGDVAVRDSFLAKGKQLPDYLKKLDAKELAGDEFDAEVKKRDALGMPLSCGYEFTSGARSPYSVVELENALFGDEPVEEIRPSV